jgi:uncharacterized protein (TIRG00374 family)
MASLERKKTPARWLASLLPWLITAIALYFAFHDIDWSVLASHLGEVQVAGLLIACGLTCASYLLRARRWQYLFPPRPDAVRSIGYLDSFRVLILGFFMNNVLPARTGELVRAHLGGIVTQEKRTLVLATIASERLADGLMLSLLFVAFAFGAGSDRISTNMLYVALIFLVASVVVVATVALRSQVFVATDRLQSKMRTRFGDSKLSGKASQYTFNRMQVFIEGLSPLYSLRRLPLIVFWTVIIWSAELAAYMAIAAAFNANFSPQISILFLVAVNFSSLIPAAPGGIGTIEAVASSVLESAGVPKELALTVVITQHVIQYVIVGIPAALIMFTWRKFSWKRSTEVSEETESSAGPAAEFTQPKSAESR